MQARGLGVARGLAATRHPLARSSPTLPRIRHLGSHLHLPHAHRPTYNPPQPLTLACHPHPSRLPGPQPRVPGGAAHALHRHAGWEGAGRATRRALLEARKPPSSALPAAGPAQSTGAPWVLRPRLYAKRSKGPLLSPNCKLQPNTIPTNGTPGPNKRPTLWTMRPRASGFWRPSPARAEAAGWPAGSPWQRAPSKPPRGGFCLRTVPLGKPGERRGPSLGAPRDGLWFEPEGPIHPCALLSFVPSALRWTSLPSAHAAPLVVTHTRSAGK